MAKEGKERKEKKEKKEKKAKVPAVQVFGRKVRDDLLEFTLCLGPYELISIG